MKHLLLLMGAAALVLTGCQSLPPGAEPGPHGTMAYDVLIEASEPGAQIEANGEMMGKTPLHLKIFGNPDGTFHDFGSLYFVIRALPQATNQFAHVRYFRTGHAMTGENVIPRHLYFDMNQAQPAEPPQLSGPPGFYPYAYPYPYPGPYYYGPPGARFYFGPGFRRHW